MTRLLSASLARRAAVTLVALALVGGAGCGGSPDAGSSRNAEDSGVAAVPASTPVDPSIPTPDERARTVIRPQLRDWIAYLRATWGATPKTTWIALKEADGRFRVEGELRGDDRGERIAAEWLVYLPLDEPDALEGVSAADRAAATEPVDPDARRLAAPPPILPGNDASLPGSLSIDDDDAFLLEIDDSSGASGDAARRGRAVIGDSPDATIRVAPGGGTVITDTGGDRITPSRLRRIVDNASALPTQVTVTWRLARPVRSREDLAGSPPAQIKITDAP